MPKCDACGLLAQPGHDPLMRVNKADRVNCTSPLYCYANVADLEGLVEARDASMQDFLGRDHHRRIVAGEERNCDMFIPSNPVLSPAEHQAVKDRQRVLQWQDAQDAARRLKKTNQIV